MSFMNRDRFLKEYELKLDKEWEVDGRSAEWAPSTHDRPLQWGEEHRSMSISRHGHDKNVYKNNATIAISPDFAFIAVSNNTTIRVYTMAQKKQRAELVGHLGNVGTMAFIPATTETSSKATYKLLSKGGGQNGDHPDETIILWSLDSEGKSLSRTMPFAIETLADSAITSISQDLTSHHDLSNEAIAEIRKGFVDVLKAADTKNRTRDLSSVNGTFPNFQSTYISHDGAHFLHLMHNESTQQGMRPENELPQILVRSITNPSTVISTLKGHKDAIMWAAFSPKDPNIIASACWDSTYRIWNTKTSCTNTIGPTKSQNWTGAFAPDGKHILLAGTDNVGIYSVDSGEKLHTLEREGLASWVRYLAWSPKGDAIALASATSIILWQPFDENKNTDVVKLSSDDQITDLFKEFIVVHWLGDGEKVAVRTAENSWLLWDREKNLKWRFQRPKGRGLPLYSEECALVKDEGGKEVFVSLDGDWKIREWVL